MVRDLILLPFRLIASGGGALIYHPRRYSEIPGYAEWIKTVRRIDYTSQGKTQTAFVDVDPDSLPQNIWLFFGGNGALALDWLPITSFAPPSSDAFVLVDYPGYGFSKGKPSPASIRASVDDLVELLRAEFKVNAEEQGSRIGVIGHSLGAAIAMDTAARLGTAKVILVSPFTSMRAIAVKTVGNFLARFLTHHYDNAASIEAWRSQRKGDEKIIIYHGSEDELIPLAMARELAATFPDAVTLNPVPDGDHNGILLTLRAQLLSAIADYRPSEIARE